MELALSLGDAPNSNNKPFGFLSKPSNNLYSNSSSSSLMALGYCVALGHHSRSGSVHYDQDRRDVLQHDDDDDDDDDGDDKNPILSGSGSGFDPPVQLDLLPLVPVPRSSHLQFSWISHGLMPEVGYSETEEKAAAGAVAAVAALSSPKSTMSCLEMELGFRKRSSLSDMENERGGGSSRIMSDDEEINNNNIIIGCAPKKLRLSKHQSAFLEESFKEHTTLNPKQKLALAKQLNLRPRQVEVWFQNRRARTKLKQTEVDCEYLRRCCETLTEENRRLQKELQELRALKTTPSHPFYNMHLPPTTLTMCPSCERVVVTTSPPAASVTVPVPNPPPSLCLANNPRISPFPHTLHQQAAS